MLELEVVVAVVARETRGWRVPAQDLSPPSDCGVADKEGGNPSSHHFSTQLHCNRANHIDSSSCTCMPYSFSSKLFQTFLLQPAKMSRFISAGADEAAPNEEDEKWLAAQKAIEATRSKPRVQAGSQEGGKSLFETLEANKGLLISALSLDLRIS